MSSQRILHFYKANKDESFHDHMRNNSKAWPREDYNHQQGKQSGTSNDNNKIETSTSSTMPFIALRSQLGQSPSSLLTAVGPNPSVLFGANGRKPL
jgi:hypothetical protein